MADPIKISRSLDAVSTGYTVFERDQVLTDDQLNGVTRYLDDQQRLSRVDLAGVGVAGGLWVGLDGNRVTVSKGVGVTTDGDILALSAAAVFDRFKPYDENAPIYPPFYTEGAMKKLYELVRLGESDVLAKPLSGFPGKLGQMVVLAYMESYEKDPDLCTGADCDNLGKDAINTQRFLLIGNDDAAGLESAAALPTLEAAGGALPPLDADRPVLDAKIVSETLLKERYRKSCDILRDTLKDALPTLWPGVGEFFPGLFPADPAAGWLSRLDQIDFDMAAAGDFGIQYYHAFLKDLVETWNDIRDALCADPSSLCPSVTAFPKHLLLGALASPGDRRTPSYPAPWQAGGPAGHARSLMVRLDTLVAVFKIPGSGPIRITPSRQETESLEERAIPYYYAASAKKPVADCWNYRLARRGEGGRIPAYFPKDTGKKAVNFLANSLGRYDFFRIEGHLGQGIGKALETLQGLIRKNNLPIALATVLVGAKREAVVPPRFKYTPLHSFHYLLRNDLASHLQDSVAFGSNLLADVTAAKDSLPTTLQPEVLGNDLVSLVKAAGDKMTGTAQTLIGVGATGGAFLHPNYVSYAQAAVSWQSPVEEAVQATSRVKSTLGYVMRNDMSSPFDAIQASKTHVWVDWLDKILQQREEARKDDCFFAAVIGRYPGLEHFGGVSRGSTFVLAHNEDGTVIGDFMVAAWIDDPDDGAYVEPKLTLPPIRLPVDVRPIKVVRPIDLVLKDFKDKQILPDIHIQENYMKFFKESLGSLGDLLNRGPSVTVPGFAMPDTGDNFLDTLLENINKERDQVEKAKDILTNPNLPAETRTQVEKYLKDTQEKLADSIRQTTEHYAKGTTDAVRTGQGATEVVKIVANGIGAVTDSGTSGQLRDDLTHTMDTMGDSGRSTMGAIVGMFGH